MKKDEQSHTPETQEEICESRRDFVRTCSLAAPALMLGLGSATLVAVAEVTDAKGEKHRYGMGVDVEKCIGCGRCADACKNENSVLREPYYFRTWVERYVIDAQGEATVDSPNGGIDGFPPPALPEKQILRSFFVPKLCNHCDKPPCVQVCPVGATFSSPEGVVLVDQDYCVGCRYCVQACPYGARYIDPRKRSADKCTFCYHRISQGLNPACVEVCPHGARIFGDIEQPGSPLVRFKRSHNIQTLKPEMNTKPKVLYANLDQEVR